MQYHTQSLLRRQTIVVGLFVLAQVLQLCRASSEDEDTLEGDDKKKQTPNEDDQDEVEESNSSSIVILILALVGVLLCFGAIIYIRRRNSDDGFASLAANIEFNDQQRMIKPSGGAMSLGSNSNKSSGMHAGSQNAASSEKIVEQNVGIVSQVGETEQLKKFSKRTAKSSIRNQKDNSLIQSSHDKDDGQFPLQTTPLALIGLNLEQNGESSNNSHLGSAPLGPVSATIAQEYTVGATKMNQLSNLSGIGQKQAVKGRKHEDTSVQNNFFSIDGDEDEQNQDGDEEDDGEGNDENKNGNSMQLEYQSDDTTFSNVFNLEGEESSKPSASYRLKKKKKKQQEHSHLFFDDKNQQ